MPESYPGGQDGANPVIQHVTVELAEDQLGECLAFYALLGFTRVRPPAGLENRAAWLEAGPTQLHLQWFDAPSPTREGHFAVILGESYEQIVAELRDRGEAAEARTEHWGSPRCFVRDPAGNKVELMERAPTPRSG